MLRSKRYVSSKEGVNKIAITVFKLLRALAGEQTGRACRSCEEPISARDELGFSEGLCGPCRLSASSASTPQHSSKVEVKPRSGPARDTHLRIMVEQMVREGRSEAAIEAAVRKAA